jgi:anhydro-N-acetylmuramic acid kinase
MKKGKNTYHAIGLMSGSSLDGLDVVYCRFSLDKTWSFKIIHTKDYSIKCWEDKLKNARNLSPEKLDLLDLAFGGFMGETVSEFIKEFEINKLDIIASHGHTIYHFPEKGITKQIGLGKQLFDKIKVPILTNLRQADIDLGGSGAPIVPIGDHHLFNKYKYCLNIGGITNISIKNENEIFAFDICSANQVLNYFAFLKEKPYDDKGELARMGSLNTKLLDKLNTLDYYKKSAPKSLDNLFTNEVLKQFKHFDVSVEDKLNTYCEHIAFQVSATMPVNENNQKEQILITGGGAFNHFLIERITYHLEQKNVEVIVPNNEIINYKEALVMGFMGVLHLRNEVNCLASGTGASKNSICGEISN